MAKKIAEHNLSNIFEETVAVEEPTRKKRKRSDKDLTEARGLGLRKSEWAEIKKISEDLGLTQHATAMELIRYSIIAYKAGKIKVKKAKQIKTILAL